MRCARCGRRGSTRLASRAPSGKLVFDWCERCLEEVSLSALGHSVPSRLPRHRASPKPRKSTEWTRLLQSRTKALLIVAVGFGFWGALVCVTGLTHGLTANKLDIDPTPLGLLRSRLLTTGGAVITSLALLVALGTVGPVERRSLVLRLVRGGFITMCAALLVLAAFRVWPGTFRQLMAFQVAALSLAWSAHAIEGRVRVLGTASPRWLPKPKPKPSKFRLD